MDDRAVTQSDFLVGTASQGLPCVNVQGVACTTVATARFGLNGPRQQDHRHGFSASLAYSQRAEIRSHSIVSTRESALASEAWENANALTNAPRTHV